MKIEKLGKYIYIYTGSYRLEYTKVGSASLKGQKFFSRFKLQGIEFNLNIYRNKNKRGTYYSVYNKNDPIGFLKRFEFFSKGNLDYEDYKISTVMTETAKGKNLYLLNRKLPFYNSNEERVVIKSLERGKSIDDILEGR